jgi:hypothetical protein
LAFSSGIEVIVFREMRGERNRASRPGRASRRAAVRLCPTSWPGCGLRACEATIGVPVLYCCPSIHAAFAATDGAERFIRAERRAGFHATDAPAPWARLRRQRLRFACETTDSV